MMGLRYSIMAIQYGATKESEIAQCNTNPLEIAEGVKQKMLRVQGRKIQKYCQVRIVDHEKRDV